MKPMEAAYYAQRMLNYDPMADHAATLQVEMIRQLQRDNDRLRADLKILRSALDVYRLRLKRSQ